MRGQPVRYHFILWIDGEPSQLHTFDIGYGDKGWYRTITSMNAFKTRENKRLNAIWGKEPISSLHKRVNVDYDFETTVNCSSAFKSMYDKLPHSHHNDIWALYQAIGYDYKAKKYTS